MQELPTFARRGLIVLHGFLIIALLLMLPKAMDVMERFDDNIATKFIQENKPIITVFKKIEEPTRDGTRYYLLDDKGNSVHVDRATATLAKEGETKSFNCDRNLIRVSCVLINKDGRYTQALLFQGIVLALYLIFVMVFIKKHKWVVSLYWGWHNMCMRAWEGVKLFGSYRPKKKVASTIYPTIVLDIDDTLYDTHSALLKEVRRLRGHLTIEEGVYLTDENTEGAISEIIIHGGFMLSAKLFPELSGLSEWMSKVRKEKPGVRFAICTHRGYHEHGDMYTQVAMKRANVTFDEAHYLDPAKYPCKIDYLDTINWEGGYVLYDDNPSPGKVHLPRNVILIQRKGRLPDSQPEYSPQWICHPRELFSHIEMVLGKVYVM